jgi:radical SAM protein with 4Fe4S-binding SPASM domain
LTVSDLPWIDAFWRDMGPFLFLREEDGVVILPPNQVYKANPSGIGVLAHMRRGGRISDLPGLADGERARQVNEFFSDLRDFCAGDTRGMDSRQAVERIPYTFHYTTLPILGEIAVTYRCNNACLFCYAGCGGPRCSGRAAGGRPEMSFREICRVIRVFKREARIPFFSFTGGEPLLRRDLERMIRCARREGLRVNLITNATLVDEARAASLAASGLGTAQVSVESCVEEEHDRLTDAPGSFRRTLAGIGFLQGAGISVQTNTTLTALNAPRAALMPAFLRGLGVRRFAMNLYIPSEPGRRPAGSADPLLLPYSASGPVIEGVRRAARAEGMTFYWYSPIPHCIYNPVARGLGNKSCAAMDGLLSVSPSGDVLPCSSYPLPMGNLLTARFRDIWFSPQAAHFKDKRYAPPGCVGCDSFTACQAACPLYWERAGTAEIAGRAREAASAAAVAR